MSAYLSPALILGVFSFAAYILGVLLMPNIQRKLERGVGRIHWVKMRLMRLYDRLESDRVKGWMRKAELHLRQPEYPLPGGPQSKPKTCSTTWQLVLFIRLAKKVETSLR